MVSSEFPVDRFCGEVVRLLDALGFEDCDLSFINGVDALRYIHLKTKAFFERDTVKAALHQVNPARIAQVAHTIPHFIVCCWSHLPTDVQADVSIFLAIMNLLDDEVNSNPNRQMATFWTDLMRGKAQEHPFWAVLGEHLPQLLRSYGSFCSFNVMRCTFDFFQGCWIEQHNFQGYSGSECFPLFIRRLNCLGGAVGGTLFPSAEFDEQALFNELTCVMAQISGPVAFVNDLLSFYKEYDQDEANLVTNWCAVDGIGMDQALQRLTDETTRSCVQILDVFKNKDPKVLTAVRDFILGYVAFHFSEQRYRLHELYERVGKTAQGAKFRRYYEKSVGAVNVNLDEWVKPAGTDEGHSRQLRKYSEREADRIPAVAGVLTARTNASRTKVH